MFQLFKTKENNIASTSLDYIINMKQFKNSNVLSNISINKQKIIKILDEYYRKDIYSQLSKAEIETMMWYTIIGSDEIYEALIKSLSSINSHKFISVSNKIMKMSKTPLPLTVYHGTNERILDYINSDSLIIPSYLSTSLSIDVAKKFMTGQRPILIKISLPIDSPAIWLKQISEFPNELELLLPNSSTLSIDKIEDYNGSNPYTLIHTMFKK